MQDSVGGLDVAVSEIISCCHHQLGYGTTDYFPTASGRELTLAQSAHTRKILECSRRPESP
jgi:hypothetical protein